MRGLFVLCGVLCDVTTTSAVCCVSVIEYGSAVYSVCVAQLQWLIDAVSNQQCTQTVQCSSAHHHSRHSHQSAATAAYHQCAHTILSLTAGITSATILSRVQHIVRSGYHPLHTTHYTLIAEACVSFHSVTPNSRTTPLLSLDVNTSLTVQCSRLDETRPQCNERSCSRRLIHSEWSSSEQHCPARPVPFYRPIVPSPNRPIVLPLIHSFTHSLTNSLSHSLARRPLQ